METLVRDLRLAFRSLRRTPGFTAAAVLILAREQGEWTTYSLGDDCSKSIDSRWATIPPNTWHRWLVGSGDWGVLSFHTVPSDELVEERPAHSDNLDSGPTVQRWYQEQD